MEAEILNRPRWMAKETRLGESPPVVGYTGTSQKDEGRARIRKASRVCFKKGLPVVGYTGTPH
jgi:hypothetical protein